MKIYTELTQFGLENPTSKISSFHLPNKEKFIRLLELMQSGYKNFKAGLGFESGEGIRILDLLNLCFMDPKIEKLNC